MRRVLGHRTGRGTGKADWVLSPSAWVRDKFYRADLELQGSIRKDSCRCVIRNDEPVITLAKERRGPWRGLLRHRVSAGDGGWRPWLRG